MAAIEELGRLNSCNRSDFLTVKLFLVLTLEKWMEQGQKMNTDSGQNMSQKVH